MPRAAANVVSMEATNTREDDELVHAVGIGGLVHTSSRPHGQVGSHEPSRLERRERSAHQQRIAGTDPHTRELPTPRDLPRRGVKVRLNS